MSNRIPQLTVMAEELHSASEEELQKLAVTVYDVVFEIYKSGENSEAKNICLEALELLNQTAGVLKGKGLLNKLLANTLHKKGNLKDSLKYNFLAGEQLLAAGEKKTAASVYGNCGALLYYLGDTAGSYKWQLKTLQISEENDLKYEKARALVNISVILEKRREYSEALSSLEQARIIFQDLSDNRGLSYSLSAIAIVKAQLGETKESLEYHEHALNLRKEMGEEREILLSFITFSNHLSDINRPEEAEQLCLQALEITDESHWPNMQAIVLLNIIDALHAQGLYKDATQRISEASALFATFDGHNDSRARLKTLESKVLFAQEKHKAAYLTLLAGTEEKDQIHKENRDEEISRMKIATEVETSLREKEIIARKNLELSETNDQLRIALARVKTLSGMLPICGSCKRIRDDDGYWQQIESYISNHSDAEFSHGLCSDCMKKLYPEIAGDVPEDT
ncbi:MAG: tetratricopeptide repeat protein [Candidatus Sabulitectum sp.]|nr:tetratricopeptide repeat protein [Candidatus Sabulitectum sp.]